MKIIRKIFICSMVIAFVLCYTGCANFDVEKPPQSAYIDEPYMLSDILMRKVADSCLQTLPIEFEMGEVIPYEALMTYYSLVACMTFDERMLSPDMLPYYDEKSMVFSVPRDMVDSYLTKRFNTTPSPKTVECYNTDADCYDIPRFNQDFYYDIFIEQTQSLGNNQHRFTVRFVHATGDLSFRETYVIELNYDGYRILERKKTDQLCDDPVC